MDILIMSVVALLVADLLFFSRKKEPANRNEDTVLEFRCGKLTEVQKR